MSIEVTSAAFAADSAIPLEFTCEGDDVSPPLAWSRVRDGAQSIAILVEDPDAPNHPFTHWLITDLPATTTSLPRGAAPPRGASEATNDRGKRGYAGPCPPSGTHHYHFHVYALDTTIGCPSSKAEFLSKIRDHVVDEGELVATYAKHRA
ncbi:MAG TPA: YbhB/YbcL family Raf kinase inhibitor-like protein [Kofleriaceae bacterium]